jgi:hypothetical protein
VSGHGRDSKRKKTELILLEKAMCVLRVRRRRLTASIASVAASALPGIGEVAPRSVRADAIVGYKAIRVRIAERNAGGSDGFAGLFAPGHVHVQVVQLRQEVCLCREPECSQYRGIEGFVCCPKRVLSRQF